MFRNKKNVLQFFCLFGFISLLSFIYSNQSDSDFKPIKGCILILARNNDLGQIQNLIKNVDLTFNKKYKYPFILFNDEEFSSDFQNKVSKFTNSTIEFGIIAKEHWNVPSWINGTKLNESVHKIGHSIGYRQMCRFNSGFFFQHELTLKYDYYMRLDSDSGFECELNEDPFRILKKNNQKYSFILSYHEGSFTIPTLWQTIKQWANKLSIKMNRNGLSFITDDNGISLNGQMCIFYNNFEMAEFSLFRNEQYQDFFHSIDKTGGFFYERWGDAPIHTYYLLMTLDINQIYRFKEIAYSHQGISSNIWVTTNQSQKVSCFVNPSKAKFECIEKWDKIYSNKMKLK